MIRDDFTEAFIWRPGYWLACKYSYPEEQFGHNRIIVVFVAPYKTIEEAERFGKERFPLSSEGGNVINLLSRHIIELRVIV